MLQPDVRVVVWNADRSGGVQPLKFERLSPDLGACRAWWGLVGLGNKRRVKNKMRKQSAEGSIHPVPVEVWGVATKVGPLFGSIELEGD